MSVAAAENIGGRLAPERRGPVAQLVFKTGQVV
jgi:hypothetical protein